MGIRVRLSPLSGLIACLMLLQIMAWPVSAVGGHTNPARGTTDAVSHGAIPPRPAMHPHALLAPAATGLEPHDAAPVPGATYPVTLPAALSNTLATLAQSSTIAFEPNFGQSASAVRYLAQPPGYTLFLTANEAELVAVQATPPSTSTTPFALLHHGLSTPITATPPITQTPPTQSTSPITSTTPPTQTTEEALRLHYVGGAASPQIDALDPLSGTVNYFLGNDSSAWHTDIPTYGEIVYRNVYPGIDLAYHSNAGSLEYTWLLSPGADPSAILLQVDGAQGLSVDAQNNLVMQTALGPMAQQAPHAYQEMNGQQVAVSVQYVLKGPNQAAFTLGSYDPSLPLTIDPVLSYSTYLGGSSADSGNGIAVDSAGNAYITGYTWSNAFPTTTNAYSTTFGGYRNAFVTKLNTAISGTAGLVYSTYLGGSGGDTGNGIAVDSAGDAYVTGLSSSANFPTTTNAYSRTLGGSQDAFVTKLNMAISGTAGLANSTYLGGSGSDQGNGI